jgi:hypothetical protein
MEHKAFLSTGLPKPINQIESARPIRQKRFFIIKNIVYK